MLTLATAGLAPPVLAEAYSETQIKAAFLFNFSHFVHWPDEAFENGSSPLRYCVTGDADMATLLGAVLAGEHAGERPLELVVEPVDADLGRCHVVYIGNDDRERGLEVLQQLRQTPALIVGDGEGLKRQDVMVRLIRKNRRVHPWIDLDVVERSDLQISSKLLRLATVKREDGS